MVAADTFDVDRDQELELYMDYIETDDVVSEDFLAIMSMEETSKTSIN